PKPGTESPSPEKTERSCCCACGTGCGPCCCCSGGAEKPDPPPDAERPWHWVASIQVQTCYGAGPASLPELPPGLPITRAATPFRVEPILGPVHLPSPIGVTFAEAPPTPPPRAA